LTPPRLAGVVAVVAVDSPDLARRLVSEGATVVLTGTGGDAAGALLAELEGGPGRAAYFHADGGADALVEFVAEQFAAGGRS
jgi:NAD(P)-dependent dehydrogenase (short-subunit alcohol dehydrogenase family)